MGITGAGVGAAPEEGRSARKRRAIMDAAATLFLRNGYQGTSMDEIAAQAAVSKQTVYKNFADKEKLFSDIILGVATSVDYFTQTVSTLHRTENLAGDLRELGRRYIKAVMTPQILQMRRLLIAEATRFPELTRAYYERAPEHVLNTLAPELSKLDERALLSVPDPDLAARHFAFLILGPALDKAMFYGDDAGYTDADLQRFADEGVRVFLAAYGVHAPQLTDV
jgi:TetR/AcrR family transcriptional regulator, mexJK operon transcriptional repressor